MRVGIFWAIVCAAATTLCNVAHAKPSVDSLLDAYEAQTAYLDLISFNESQETHMRLPGDDRLRHSGRRGLSFWRRGDEAGSAYDRYDPDPETHALKFAFRVVRAPLAGSGYSHGSYDSEGSRVEGTIVYFEDRGKYLAGVYSDLMGGSIVDGIVHEAYTGRATSIVETLRALAEKDPLAVRVETIGDGGAALVGDTHDGRYWIEFTAGPNPVAVKTRIERVGTPERLTAAFFQTDIVGTVVYETEVLRREQMEGHMVPSEYTVRHLVDREDGQGYEALIKGARMDIAAGKSIEPEIAEGTRVLIVGNAEHAIKRVIRSVPLRNGQMSEPMELEVAGMTGVTYVWRNNSIQPMYNNYAIDRIDAWATGMREQGFDSLDAVRDEAFAGAALAAEGAQANAAADPEDEGIGVIMNHPHCGIHVVYALRKLIDPDFAFETLLSPVYVGDPSGSSMQELAAAAVDSDLHSLAASGMTLRDLLAARLPILLHVRSSPIVDDFDHWTLYLGRRGGGKALLYDSGFGVKEVEFAELLSRWDGNGVYVSDAPIRPFSVKAGAMASRTLFMAVAGLALVGAGLLARRALAACFPRLSRGALLSGSVVAVGGVVFLGVSAAAAHHSLSPQGFFRNPEVLRAVKTRYFSDFLASVDSETLDAIIQKPGDTIVVDARSHDVYRLGLRIEGAINIPVSFSIAQVGAALRGVEKHAQIIVYCQNIGCSFDDVVARKIHSLGYDNIKLYDLGWDGWSEHKGVNEAEILFGDKE